MQLYLRNQINVDGQAEVIEQSYPVEVTEKNGFSYLVFTNEEDEKVIMKCSDEELAVTRFSVLNLLCVFIRTKKP